MQRITDMKLNRPYILYICICLWLLFLPSCTNRLWGKDFVVVIDAGHGGHDPGAIGKISKEKNINLNVALKVGNLIKKNCDDVKLIYVFDMAGRLVRTLAPSTELNLSNLSQQSYLLVLSLLWFFCS